MSDDDIIQAAAKAINDDGGTPGSSLHSWRCEYPDRYGPCDCVAETARAVVAAVRPLILKDAAEKTGFLETGAGVRAWLQNEARAVGVGGQHTDTPQANT